MSASILVDQPARDRIATDLDCNLGVEAAAGTGKTTVLVERVVNLLASGRVNADELVVITFTENAAAELATRVRDALEERAASTEGEERARILQAAGDLYRAHIETIHSFAAALLRERPVEAPIDPLFEVLDELAAGLEFNRAYERFQDELFAEPRPELELALRRGLGLTELREACECLNEHRYLLPLKHPEPQEGELERLLADLGSIAADLQTLLARHQPGEDRAVPIVEGILEWIEALEALDSFEQERWLLSRQPAKTNLAAGLDKNWGGEKSRLKQLQQSYGEAVERAQITMRCNALLAVLPHVERFVEQYTQRAQARRAG